MKPFSSPTVINLEITDACNAECRHCYNSRRGGGKGARSLSRKRMDELAEMFLDAGVFHVILTGGEPFANFDILEYGLQKLVRNNISVSCNSNLTLASDDRIKRLRDAGLDHILTSLNSYDPETNDYMAGRAGAFKKIVDGIESAIRGGLRISVNMIVSRRNMPHVYQTAKFARGLGCGKIFGTRLVPPHRISNRHSPDFELAGEDAKFVLEQLIRAKDETGIMIGALVSYPLCLLGDLERYRDFVGRGCPAQSGHLMSIDADGGAHACVHQEESCGNVFEMGIGRAYGKMSGWYEKQYRYSGCAGCDYMNICDSGCRMSAAAYSGSRGGMDPLMAGKGRITKPYKMPHDGKIRFTGPDAARFIVPKRLRFRRENGFYLVNIRWANTVTCPIDVGEFLIRYQKTRESFGAGDIGPGHENTIEKLFFKDAVELAGAESRDGSDKLGLSVDITNII